MSVCFICGTGGVSGQHVLDLTSDAHSDRSFDNAASKHTSATASLPTSQFLEKTLFP